VILDVYAEPNTKLSSVVKLVENNVFTAEFREEEKKKFINVSPNNEETDCFTVKLTGYSFGFSKVKKLTSFFRKIEPSRCPPEWLHPQNKQQLADTPIITRRTTTDLINDFHFTSQSLLTKRIKGGPILTEDLLKIKKVKTTRTLGDQHRKITRKNFQNLMDNILDQMSQTLHLVDDDDDENEDKQEHEQEQEQEQEELSFHFQYNKKENVHSCDEKKSPPPPEKNVHYCDEKSSPPSPEAIINNEVISSHKKKGNISGGELLTKSKSTEKKTERGAQKVFDGNDLPSAQKNRSKLKC